MATTYRSPSVSLLAFTFFHLISAAAGGSSALSNSESYCTLPEPSAPLCSIEGQPDFYGLGVRMGIYFTWLTSWIANNFLEEEISGSLDTNAVFLLAIFVTVMFNSIWHQLRMIDALVLLHLCYGFLFGVMSLWGYRTMFYHRMGAKGRSHFGGFGTHLRLLLMTAISGYAVWFWFEGLDDGLIQCNKREACGGLEAFFFVKVKLFGWIRTFYKVGAIFCVLYYGTMCIVAIVALSVRFLKFAKSGWSGWRQGFEEEEFEDTGLSQRELSYAYLALASFNLFWMIFAAVIVELTLIYNHVTGVLGESGLSGPGQQIPLLIGAFSFLRILWLIFKEYYFERHENTKETRGLGIRKSRTGNLSTVSTPVTPAASRFPQQHSHLNSIPLLAKHADRPWVHRVLVTWLPWLTDIEAFSGSKSNNGQRFEPVGSNGETAEVTAAVEMQKTGTNVTYNTKSNDVEKAGPSGVLPI